VAETPPFSAPSELLILTGRLRWRTCPCTRRTEPNSFVTDIEVLAQLYAATPELHPLSASVFPPLAKAEVEVAAERISMNGRREPSEIVNGAVVSQPDWCGGSSRRTTRARAGFSRQTWLAGRRGLSLPPRPARS
jgi:hypothetical protein